MLGKLTPGTGWHKRTDSHYRCPTSVDELRRRNEIYVNEKLAQSRTSEHWQTMLDEFLRTLTRTG